MLRTDGSKIIASHGEAVLLRGINLGNWLVPEGYMFGIEQANSPRLLDTLFKELVGPHATAEFWRKFQENYLTRDDIHFIKQSGFNSIRVPFSFRLFMEDDKPNSWKAEGFEPLDRVIKWCKEEGLWVVLDLHCAPGGQTGDNIDDGWGYPWLFEDPQAQEMTVTLWRKIAGHYKTESTVAGYDLFNEPIAHFFDVDKINPQLEPLYRKIVASIREVDPNHIIILEGAQWASKFEIFSAPFAGNLVYSFHKYWTAPDKSVVQSYLDFAQKHKVPLYLGESGENSDEWIGKFRATLEAENISWCFWPYKKLNKTSCIVSIDTPKHWQEIVDYAAKPRGTFEQVRKARQEAKHASEVLEGFLMNCQFSRCKPNRGFIKALMPKAVEK